MKNGQTTPPWNIDALRLVIELAQQSVIDDPDMEKEAEKQRDAIARVTTFLKLLENS